MVSNTNSVAAKYASQLFRRHAWVVTGTPVAARLNELHGLLGFLAHRPFAEASCWREALLTPYGKRPPAGLLRMRGLLRDVLLRRHKRQVLSPRTLSPFYIENTSVHRKGV